MSSLFLFGAGASYGSGPCVHGGGGDRYVEANPPLGWGLFGELQKVGGAASIVSDRLAQVFSEDFERGMEQFLVEHNARLTEFHRDIARYLARFEPLEGNCYRKLVKVLGGRVSAGTRKKVVLATTNYDLLIERAFGEFGFSYNFPAPGTAVPILKIHGSCNFLPDTRGMQLSGVELSYREGVELFKSQIIEADSTQEILDYCNEQDSVAPALAIYSPSKGLPYGREFVTRQQAEFHSALRQVSRVFVVGLRVHPVDEHIWEPLAASSVPLYCVDPDREAFEEWLRKSGRRNGYYLARTFEQSIPLIAHVLA